jgi:hypothetical protein
MKDPAVLFYTQDFLTGTMLMTDTQIGKYIKLLCLQHQNGKLSEKDMLKICGEFDADIWAKFYQEDGFFYNKRMLLETTKRNKFCEHQKENINKRWGKKEYHGNTTVIPLENENEIVNENVIKDKDELLKKRENEFRQLVFECDPLKYPQVMLENFCRYWTEPNKSKTKMRFELEKVFDIPRRLVTWASRDKEINKNNGTDKRNYQETAKHPNDQWKEN